MAIHTLNLEREKWLKLRKAGIGGSDVAAILGLNRYKSAMEVYYEKTEQIPLEEPDNEFMYWGNVHEDTVAKEFAKRTGLKVRRHNFFVQHKEHKFLAANVDRIIIDKERGNGVLECKTASAYVKDQWKGDKVPDEYYLQLQHYLNVLDLSWGAIAVLIGGNQFYYQFFERDEELIKLMTSESKKFWYEHVQKRVPPEIDGSDASSSYLKERFPESEKGSEIVLPTEADQWLAQYDKAKELKKKANLMKQEAENHLKDILGSNEIGLAGDRKVSWKNVSSNRLDQKRLEQEMPEVYEKYLKPSSSRRFQIIK